MVENVGFAPSYDEMMRYKDSPQFDPKLIKFKNKLPDLFERMRIRNLDWNVITEWFVGFEQETPPSQLPEVKTNLADFCELQDQVASIWLGHSTILMNFYGKIVLFDPIFSDAASPIKIMVRRFQKPVFDIKDIPKIDFVLISHDHYDHLDMESIKALKNKTKHFIVPLGVSYYLKYWGVSSQKITELDWWQGTEIEDVKFIATPAQHFSGRSGFWNNVTLWSSWIVQNSQKNIYFSGDSGYGKHFKQIGDKYGPFDLAFIENGQYNVKWREVHLLPDESVQAFEDLRAKIYFPIHWGMFDLSLHPWDEPIRYIFKLSQKHQFQLVAPKLGETYHLDDSYTQEKWWRL
ncbi:MAG: hydrolase [Halobacteriovoraceae bacterium]|nr:hydrolase [Halobacteriovoraceae bacterium]